MGIEVALLTAGGLPLLVLLLTAAVRVDHQASRLSGLAKDGASCSGWRIVHAKRWVNARAGLLNQAGLASGTGLWLSGVKSIHTCGMLFPIDVVFLTTDGSVAAVHVAVEPGVRRVAGPKGTVAALELPAGGAAQLGVGLGVRLTRAPQF